MFDKEDQAQTRKTVCVMPEGCGATIYLGAREFDGAWRRRAEPKSYNYAGTYDCLTCVGVSATKRSFEHTKFTIILPGSNVLMLRDRGLFGMGTLPTELSEFDVVEVKGEEWRFEIASLNRDDDQEFRAQS